jgi:hypothetical protein
VKSSGETSTPEPIASAAPSPRRRPVRTALDIDSAALVTTRLGFSLPADHSHERAMFVPDDVGLLLAEPAAGRERIVVWQGRLAGEAGWPLP